MRKCQGAFEFILSYGWVFIVLLIIIFIMFGMNIFNPFTKIKRAWDFDFFEILDWKVSGSDSPYMNNTFHVVIGNKYPYIRSVDYINIYDVDGNYCGTAVLRDYEVDTRHNAEWDTGGVIFENCSGHGLQDYKYYIKIGFTKKSGLQHVDKGFVEFHHEDIQDVIHFGDWYHSDYGGDVTKWENGSLLGSYAGSCPAITPVQDNVSFVLGGAPVNWNRPGGCSAGQCHGVERSGHCNQSCNYMAHGWLKSVIIAPRETRGHEIYLAGNATCNDSRTLSSQGYDCSGSTHLDKFICMNDDIYFYVNQDLLNFSGLSYTAYKCGDECAFADYWCVPPIDITQSPYFRWDDSNTVWVLVEDWCGSGGVGHMDFMVDPPE